ncbi:response regulator [Brotaphodocola sp.]|uniref:response regulator n=1 Tax=Brotaphodocola sp. TaxID=3073577 RepID=UPI003D7E8FBC
MYRLLIADDEMIERKVLLKTLRGNLEGQCELFEAKNGREALEVYEKEKIQIAILDIEMPGINGIQVAEKIRESDKECCIIFLTAYDEFAYAKKAIAVRVLDYILKPWDEKELMLVLEEAMRLAGKREHHLEEGKEPLEKKSAQKMAESLNVVDTEMTGMNENLRIVKVAEIIKEYICANYMKDLSVQKMADMVNYSEPYFCRVFKQSFGQNFTSYLTEYRINMAKKMLEQPTVNVKDIGKMVGYEDSNYFTKVFKRIAGQSPTEYRNIVFREN